jgi:hypothetical protein
MKEDCGKNLYDIALELKPFFKNKAPLTREEIFNEARQKFGLSGERLRKLPVRARRLRLIMLKKISVNPPKYIYNYIGD